MLPVVYPLLAERNIGAVERRRPPSDRLVIYPGDKGQRSRENYKNKLVFTIENLMKAKTAGDIVSTRREVYYWS